MSTSKFVQRFSGEFEGINAESSPIEADGNSVSKAVNYEIGPGNFLRGRLGHQLASGCTGFYGLFNYTYSRTQDEYVPQYRTSSGVYPNRTGSIGSTKTSADGATISKLIGINCFAWEYDTFTVPVTRVSGSYPFTWYLDASHDEAGYLFKIKSAGTEILSVNLGTVLGSLVPNMPTIYSLLGQIDAIPELSVNRFDRAVCPPCAIADGTQWPTLIASASWGFYNRVTVLPGHSFVVGDVITWYIDDVNSEGFVGGWVAATTATTITFVSGSSGFAGQIFDGQVLGYQGQCPAAFDIGPEQSASSGTLNIRFPYWRKLPDNETIDREGAFRDAWVASITYQNFILPTATSADGNLYIAASSYPDVDRPYSANLMKYDGHIVTRAGLSTPDTFTVTAAAGGALSGTYKYKAYVKRVDARGNIIEGPLTATSSIVLGGGNNQATITALAASYLLRGGFGVKSAYKYTNETPASDRLFYIDNNVGAPGEPGYFEVGDPICFYDNTGTLHRTRVTAYDGTTTPSSIKVADSGGYQINDNTPMSSGMTVVVLRTTAGGNQFYVLREIVTTGYAAETWTDNTSDATLTAGIQWTDPQIGKEHNPPPQCALVSQHQGGLVVARTPSQPNTVAFSSADGIEYFPTASNSFDVPSTVVGPITAIASDTSDRLAVFKDRAYYDVIGDLDSGAFSINVKHEGDFGITSQASLCRVNGRLVGLSRNGIVTISDGELESMTFRGINAGLVNRTWLYELAFAANDYTQRQYILSIPTSIANLSFPKTLVIDYSRPKILTFEREFDTGIRPSNSYAMLGDRLYFLERAANGFIHKRLYRFNGDSPTGDDGASFLDGVAAIRYVIESEPYTFGEPGLLKVPSSLRIWSIPSDEVVSGWVPFSMLVETATAPIPQYIGSPNPGATSTTVNFAVSATDWFKDVKLVPAKAFFYIVRLTTYAYKTAPFLSGYEIKFALAYEKEGLTK